ncbi:MAG: hypothetical protein MHM6MM_002085 [Cercozoa sp. M6MM]
MSTELKLVLRWKHQARMREAVSSPMMIVLMNKGLNGTAMVEWRKRLQKQGLQLLNARNKTCQALLRDDPRWTETGRQALTPLFVADTTLIYADPRPYQEVSARRITVTNEIDEEKPEVVHSHGCRLRFDLGDIEGFEVLQELIKEIDGRKDVDLLAVSVGDHYADFERAKSLLSEGDSPVARVAGLLGALPYRTLPRALHSHSTRLLRALKHLSDPEDSDATPE